MISKWQFWLITVFVALATGVAYIVTWSPLSLWMGGGILFFWINGRIREEISDSYYINAAYTTLTACVLTVPQIFYGGTAGGLAMYIVTVVYQLLAFFTNIDYVSHRSVAAVGRNWRSNTKNRAQKILDHYTITEGNWAGLVLAAIAFLGGAFGILVLWVKFSLFFLLLIPVYTLFGHLVFLLYMCITGVTAPTGYAPHDDADNLFKGFWYLIRLVGQAVVAAVVAMVVVPARFIARVCGAIADFFGNIRDGGRVAISKFFWICVGALGVYLILSIFGIADFIEEIFGSFNGVGMDINIFLFPITNFIFGIDLGSSFFTDVILFLPKIIVIVVGAVLDVVLLLLVCLLWLVLNAVLFILWFLLVFSFEALLPILLGVGAIVFVVLYLIQSDRGFFDWLRAVLFSLIPIGLFVLYVLFFNGVIKLF